ncbi:MAG: hypothetical protein Q9221_007873 [Calogaya cf. arnoldii]
MPRITRALTESHGYTLPAPRPKRAANGKTKSEKNTPPPATENNPDSERLEYSTTLPRSSATPLALRCVVIACHLLYGSSFAEIECKIGVPEEIARDIYHRALQRAGCDDLHQLLACVGDGEFPDESASAELKSQPIESNVSEQWGEFVEVQKYRAFPRPKRKLAEFDDNASSAPRPKRVSHARETSNNDTALAGRKTAFAEENTASIEERTAPAGQNTSTTEKPTSPTEKNPISAEEDTSNMWTERRVIGGRLVWIVPNGEGELPDLPGDAVSALNVGISGTSKPDTPQSAEVVAAFKKKEEAKMEHAYNADDNTWICMCRSKADMQREQPEYEDKIRHHLGRSDCMDAMQQGQSRDQDLIGLFQFPAWNQYAICEVVENMSEQDGVNQDGKLAAFNKAVKSLNDWFTVWTHTEGLGRFLQFLSSHFPYYSGISILSPKRQILQTDTRSIDNYREANAKRLMLIGTALLSAMDVLKSHKLFHSNNNTEVRNIGLILCHYLQFAYDQREIPRLNEAGWTKLVIHTAEEHGIRIEGFYGIEKVVSALRKSSAGNSGNASDSGKIPPGGNQNMIYAYQSAPPLEGLLTAEKVKAHEKGGTRRDWGKYDLKKEVAAYRRYQMVKVGPEGPADYGGTRIGGKFYDLTGSYGRMLVREQERQEREKEREVERIEKEKRRVEREAGWAAIRARKREELEKMKREKV